EIMSFPLITIKASSSPSAAADMMLKNNVRHLLVVEEDSANRPIGVITAFDFTSYQEYTADEDKEAIEKVLENYMSSADADAFTGV
ncbi:MAG TPA: CBS domain-containing protein, partial [Candidatus Acidoferrum sp.]|nr:CBS domain-containing protein [Candidatus Acidoferrum sp.]